MSGEAVGQILDRVLGHEPVPRSITGDHGTEFQSRALEDWAIGGVCNSTSFDRANPWKMPPLSR